MTFKVKTKGQIEGEKLLVPKLRFKEFNNQWRKIKLKDISTDISYGMNSAATEYDGFNKYIRITDIDEETSLYNNNPVSPSGNLDDKFLVKDNDILFARTGASTGKAYLYNKTDGKLYFAGFLIRANIKKDYNSRFIFEQTKLGKYNNWVKIMSIRSGQPGINSIEYGNYEFSITHIDEQKKIANVIELVNKKIELQKQKIEALKIYKKGLLHKTFINCCANCKIKDLLIMGKSGGTPKSTNTDYYDGNIPFLSISDMTSQGKYIKQTEKHISNLGLKNSSAWLLPVNTLILSMYASYGLLSINKISLSTSQAMFNMIFKENINVEYIYYYLSYLKDRHFYEELVSTGTQANLNADKVKNMPIYLPNKTEQYKISNLFNILDNKLGLQESNLNNLIMLKKSLLQQMFI